MYHTSTKLGPIKEEIDTDKIVLSSPTNHF